VQSETRSPTVVVVDSVTQLGMSARNRVVVCGSHGAAFSAQMGLRASVAAIIFSDAGVGKDRAGIQALDMLARHAIPSATVDYRSARIGDGRDLLLRGIISHVNAAAAAVGCERGMSVRETSTILLQTAPLRHSIPAADADRGRRASEARYLLLGDAPQVWALDSVSLVEPDDGDHIVFTGSHGRLLGGAPETAMRGSALAAVFNDAGCPDADDLGGRLGPLGLRGIPAATVHAESARIGDGRSTYYDGVLSAVNEPAAAMGACVDMSAQEFAELVRARHRATQCDAQPHGL
jgi:hypothetical protein